MPEIGIPVDYPCGGADLTGVLAKSLHEREREHQPIPEIFHNELFYEINKSAFDDLVMKQIPGSMDLKDTNSSSRSKLGIDELGRNATIFGVHPFQSRQIEHTHGKNL